MEFTPIAYRKTHVTTASRVDVLLLILVIWAIYRSNY